MGLLINIDNGGTFTDICVSDGSRVLHAKTPTTAHDLTICFLEALRRASEELFGAVDLQRLLRDTQCLRYSTTSGTNAVVERRGAPVGLLVGREAGENAYGAADLVHAELWNAMIPGKPAVLDVAADGRYEEQELLARVNDLIACGAGRLVVSLTTAEAERAVKAALLERYPRHLLGAIPFLLSHELTPGDADDARRTITAVINAYLHPGMEHFLYNAQSAAADNGLARPLLIFRNDGDSARVAKTSAIRTWGSGPRGGLEGATAYARLYDAANLLTMDIGGTTTDLSVLTDQALRLASFGRVDGAPVSLPLPELESVGLGGSSVVRVVDGTLTVGPDSVGAAPGPACFARGGTQPTLTDALAVLGVLDPSRYLGGSLPLDVERARRAIAEHIGAALGLETEAAAVAIVEAFAAQVGAHVAALLQGASVAAEDTTLLAFGGGGPVIATQIAAAAGIGSVVVPQLAAVFSAFGIGFSGIAHDYVHRLGDNPEANARIRDDMLTRARRDLFGERVDPKQAQYAFALRDDSGPLLVEQSVAAQEVPAHTGSTIRLRATSPLPTFDLTPDDDRGPTQVTAHMQRPVGGDTTAVYDPERLTPGDGFAGPALVSGDYLTAYVLPGWSVRVSPNHDLILENQR